MGKIELHISTPQKLVDVLNSFNSVKNQFDSSQNRFQDFMKFRSSSTKCSPLALTEVESWTNF